MKKFVAAAAIAAVSLFAGASAASAQDGYGTTNPTVTVSSGSPTAGSAFSVTVANCTPGGTATFVFQGSTQTATVGSAGTATASFTAPASAGTYSGTATCNSVAASFSVTVPAGGGLPATGSDSNGPTIAIASILLLAGVGMFGVANARRRDQREQVGAAS